MLDQKGESLDRRHYGQHYQVHKVSVGSQSNVTARLLAYCPEGAIIQAFNTQPFASVEENVFYA